ncbi:hypothetical protein [Vibrio splendidus]|uniref:hypothetical protein n=1 Tax=Vibrio splendidus TaxID=29497 RepID=UPI0011B5E973|nr:hypothetical protein [Vibrio splendidus]
MELRDFIKSSLKDIIGGVTDAQNEIEKGEIVPKINESSFSFLQSDISSVQAIEFEVAVNTIEREGSEAKLNVVAAVIGGSVGGNSSNDSTHAAKLSFKVPVRFPKSSS